jgi:O-antigen ligase
MYEGKSPGPMLISAIDRFIERKYEVIDKCIEGGIYLFIIFLFVTKGEGIRNILLFTNFSFWLITLKYRKNKHILVEPLSLLFWGNIISIILSIVFSIDVLYSFRASEGDFLKSILLFPVLTTILTDKNRLKRFIYVSLFLLLFTSSAGFYSYLVHGTSIQKIDTPLRHAMHNRFARDLNSLLPFAFVLLFITRGLMSRILISMVILAGISTLIFSLSRGGVIAFLSTMGVWLLYSLRKKEVNLKFVLVSIPLAFILLGMVLYYFSPDIRNRVSSTKTELTTFNERTPAWIPVIYAAAERPIFGWGCGNKIFRMDLPFEKTPQKVSPFKTGFALKNPHNTFLSKLFHQGIVGLTLYLTLLIVATITFWKKSLSSHGLKSFILIACTSVLIGTYFIHSMAEVVTLKYLTLILGVGIAAQNVSSEDSNN